MIIHKIGIKKLKLITQLTELRDNVCGGCEGKSRQNTFK